MKTVLLSFYLLLLAGFASAQCNPQFTATASPSGNSLLRAALVNTTSQSWTSMQYPQFWYIAPAGGTYTGNGNPSVGSTNAMTFNAPGTYQVGIAMRLIDSLTGSVICTDTNYQVVTVAYPSCGTTISYTIGSAGSYSFTANTPSANPGMTYGWNFGDGTATVTGITPTHTYLNNGVYTVTLTASGSNNCIYTNTVTVIVSNIPINCTGNHALFSTAINGATVTFSNQSSGPQYPGIQASYFWYFGDGNTATAVNPVYTYGASGTYNAYLVSIWGDSASSTSLCRDTLLQSITVTAPPAPNLISGIVIRPDTVTSGRNDAMRVWLISYNQSTNMLQAIDSVTVDSAYKVGSSFFNDYWFTNVADGSYLLKAARIGGTAGNYGPIPTYHDSSYYWNSATPITVIGGASNNNGFITMRMGIVNSGSGFIGGNVSLGANRGTASGVPGMVILLRNTISNVVYRSVVTNANGDYSFSGVPAGLYSIYPEELDYTTIPYTNVAITNAQNNVGYINFNKDGSNKTIKPRATSIAAINANGTTVILYPNPAKGAVTISWKGLGSKAIDVTISNITGQVVLTRQINGSADTSMPVDIARLQPGIYTVRLHTASGDAVQKLVVQP